MHCIKFEGLYGRHNGGTQATSAGRLFLTVTPTRKKLYLNALMDPGGTWSL